MKGNDHNLHNLTDRELEVMILMAQGHSCQDSADKLHISPRTVQVHRNNIRLKIGLESALQLHAYAVRFYGENSINQGHGIEIVSINPVETNQGVFKDSAPQKNPPRKPPLVDLDHEVVKASIRRVVERFT